VNAAILESVSPRKSREAAPRAGDAAKLFSAALTRYYISIIIELWKLKKPWARLRRSLRKRVF